jgi:hypothetical protein
MSELGQGAFRRAPVHELCACGEAANERCERCAVPLCSRHGPAFAHRCANCEDAYASLLRDRQLNPLTGLQLLLTYLLAIGGVVGAWCLVDVTGWGADRTVRIGVHFSLSQLLMLLVAIPACLLPALAIHWRRIRLRGAFLRERPGRRRLRVVVRPRRPTGELRPAPTIGDSFAVAALILNLIFFIPALPAIGLTLALLAVLGRRRFQTSSRRAMLASGAIVAGVLAGGLQLFVLLQMVRGRW